MPFRGPALLVCNHLSHVDGLLVGSCVQRFIRFLVYRPYFEHWALQSAAEADEGHPGRGRPRRARVARARAARACRTDTSSASSRKASISRTGNMLPFKRGFERIVDGLDVPVIPVYLDRVWGSIFSFKGGRFFWKWPVRVPYPVTVAFGAPLPSTTTAAEARLALHDARLRAGDASAGRPTNRSGRQFVRTAKHHWWSFCDGRLRRRKPLTFGRVLVGALAALAVDSADDCRTNRTSACCCRHRSAARSPTSARRSPAKCPVNLNFTAGRESMATAIERCGIKTILTSRRFSPRPASSRSTAWCSSKT